MKTKTIPLYLVIILSTFTLVSCSKNNDVDILKQRITDLTSAIEKHDEQGLNDYLSSDFSVSERFNKTQFFLFIRYHFKNNNNISLTILNKDIILHENYADVTADVLLLGAEGWLPERGQRYYVESRWKKEKGDWFMSRLRWTVNPRKLN